MSKAYPGLQYDKKTGEWGIDKKLKGFGRIRQRLQASSREEAEMMFLAIIAEMKGVVHKSHANEMLFREAGERYIKETNKRSLSRDVISLELLDPYIGDLPLTHVHTGTLQSFIDDRRQSEIRSSTVTRDLAVVRQILKLAALSWRNALGQPYLINPPLIKMPDWEDAKKPYPLNWDQQRKLFRNLPRHLKLMALFAVNTGLRDQSICCLRWDWEVNIPELNTSVFITPGDQIEFDGNEIGAGEKNKEDQLVVLNRVAKKVIEIQRGRRKSGSPWVFPYQGRHIDSMNNSGWKEAWKKAKLPAHKSIMKGPHNLKHTFGRRLRMAGVNLETRKSLLHHTQGDVTLTYSPADVQELVDAAEKVVKHKAFRILRRAS